MEKEKGSKRNSSLEDALSVQMDISSVAIFLQQKTHVPSGRLSFVWLCVSSIKRGARRIIPLDELSFAILFERRIKRSSSFAWYKRRITRRTHSLQICLVPRLHYCARPMRFGSRGPSEFRLPAVTTPKCIDREAKAWEDAVQRPGNFQLTSQP